MKTKNLTLILFLIITISSSFEARAIEHCEAKAESCEFYLCKEKERLCGEKGYLINFGHKYCDKFLQSDMSKYSALGKQWVKSVRLCLQEKVSDISMSYTCKELKKEAFIQHIDCYTSAGFCELPLKDKARILYTIKTAIATPRVLISGLKVLRECSRGYEENSSYNYFPSFLD